MAGVQVVCHDTVPATGLGSRHDSSIRYLVAVLYSALKPFSFGACYGGAVVLLELCGCVLYLYANYVASNYVFALSGVAISPRCGNNALVNNVAEAFNSNFCVNTNLGHTSWLH